MSQEFVGKAAVIEWHRPTRPDGVVGVAATTHAFDLSRRRNHSVVGAPGEGPARALSPHLLAATQSHGF